MLASLHVFVWGEGRGDRGERGGREGGREEGIDTSTSALDVQAFIPGLQPAFQPKSHKCLMKAASFSQCEQCNIFPFKHSIPFQDGQYERLENLLSQHRSAVNARRHMTGDTPLIAAARNGHRKVG